MSLVIAAAISERIDSLKRELPHAILLAGKQGIGLRTIAQEVAASNEVVVIEPSLINKTSTTKQISVSVVRELYESTRSKSPRRRVVIVDDIDTMTVQAQNAFLKLLEEPNESTSFILTTHQLERLLPTIRSRVQLITVPPLSKAETAMFIDSLDVSDEKRRSQLLFIANGLPAELTKLVRDEDYFKQISERVILARHMLQSGSYERLKQAMANSPNNRTDAIGLIDQLISLVSMRPDTTMTAERIEKLLVARERISLNANVKLQLASAML